MHDVRYSWGSIKRVLLTATAADSCSCSRGQHAEVMQRGLSLQVWISPDGGFADDYVKVVREWTNQNTELTVVSQLAIFALFHSGLAYLRPFGAPSGASSGHLCIFLRARCEPVPSRHQTDERRWTIFVRFMLPTALLLRACSSASLGAPPVFA